MIYKIIADSLTILRFLISIYLVYTGIFKGIESFFLVSILVIIGWLTDALDGEFARASGLKSWIGEQEGYVDLIFGYSILFYMLFSGILPIWIVILITVPGFIYILFQKIHYGMLFSSLVYLFLIINVCIYLNWWVILYLAYMVGTVIFKWHRFKTQVKDFLQGFSLFKRKKQYNSYTYKEKES